MKLILSTLSTLAAFGLLITALHAADAPAVVLNDNGTISRGGTSLNNASDALLNKLVTPLEFQRSLAAWQKIKLDAVTSAQADTALIQAQITAKLDAATQQLQAALAAATDDAAKEAITGQIDLVVAFKADAVQSPDQLRAAALQATITASQAELAALAAKQAAQP
jgi:hypothetical protein